MTAKRSPIGNAAMRLSQRATRTSSSRDHSERTRAASERRRGAGAGPLAVRRASAAAPRWSSGCSSGGWRTAPVPSRCTNACEKSDVWRTLCSTSALHASSHTGSPARLAPIARPANTRYSFVRSSIESSHAPNLENWRV